MPKQSSNPSTRAVAQAKQLAAQGKTTAAKAVLRAERNRTVDDSYTQPKRARMPDSLVVGKAKRPDDAVGGPTAKKYQKMKGK